MALRSQLEVKQRATNSFALSLTLPPSISLPQSLTLSLPPSPPPSLSLFPNSTRCGIYVGPIFKCHIYIGHKCPRWVPYYFSTSYDMILRDMGARWGPRGNSLLIHAETTLENKNRHRLCRSFTAASGCAVCSWSDENIKPHGEFVKKIVFFSSEMSYHHKTGVCTST